MPAAVSPKSVPPTATLYGVEAKRMTPIPYMAVIGPMIGRRGGRVAGGDKHRYAFGRGSLIQGVDVAIDRGSGFRLRRAIADADDAGKRAAVGQHVLKRDESAEVGRIRAGCHTMAALGAAALAHSTSMAASQSSPLTPGSTQAPPGPVAGWTWVSEP